MTVDDKQSLKYLNLKIYHLVYEPSFQSAVFHFWTECNLNCRGCYCPYEPLDFGLFDDWQGNLASKTRSDFPPDRFINLQQTLSKLDGLEVERAIFIGTEPALDPGLPVFAERLHHKFHSYNILFTNGLKLPDTSHIDEFIVSLKAITPQVYYAYTGGDNHKALDNFRQLYAMGKRLQAEVLFVPGIIETEEIENVARFVASVSQDITLRVDGYLRLSGVPYRGATPEDIEKAVSVARKHLNRVNFLTADLKRVGEKPLCLF